MHSIVGSESSGHSHLLTIGNDVSSERIREMFDRYAPCMVAIITTDENEQVAVGAGFHIGDGWIVTARHVVDSRRIVKLEPHRYAQCSRVERIIFPSDPKEDLALMLTDFSLKHYMSSNFTFSPPRDKYDHIPLGSHLSDWIGDELVLSEVLIIGYPSIPTADHPTLVAVKGEVNAIVDSYLGPAGQPYFITSPVPRGGFSGGPVISEWDFLLGVQTDSFITADQIPELGFAAALTVEPLWGLLFDNEIYPASNAVLAYALGHLDVSAMNLTLGQSRLVAAYLRDEINRRRVYTPDADQQDLLKLYDYVQRRFGPNAMELGVD